MWFHGTGSDQISDSHQMAIDNTTQNIFVADNWGHRILVFNAEGNHLYEISTSPFPVGIALTDEYIFVLTGKKLVQKIQKSSHESIKCVATEEDTYGIETNSNSDTTHHIYLTNRFHIYIPILIPLIHVLPCLYPLQTLIGSCSSIVDTSCKNHLLEGASHID